MTTQSSLIKRQIKPIRTKEGYQKVLATLKRLGAKRVDTFPENNNSFQIFFLKSTQTAYILWNTRGWNGVCYKTYHTLLGPYLTSTQITEDRQLPLPIKSWLPHWSKIATLLDD